MALSAGAIKTDVISIKFLQRQDYKYLESSGLRPKYRGDTAISASRKQGSKSTSGQKRRGNFYGGLKVGFIQRQALEVFLPDGQIQNNRKTWHHPAGAKQIKLLLL